MSDSSAAIDVPADDDSSPKRPTRDQIAATVILPATICESVTPSLIHSPLAGTMAGNAADGVAGTRATWHALFESSDTTSSADTIAAYESGETFIEGYQCVGDSKRGGMGIVFPAIETALGRTVAVKIVARHQTSELAIERFESEMRMLAMCSHPSIVSVLVANLHHRPPYFTMPWIEGKTLSDDVAASGRPDAKTAAWIAREVALALAHAHQMDILHRDLKPSNVMLVRTAGANASKVRDKRALFGKPDSPMLSVKVLDFGLAMSSDGDETRNPLVSGTPEYMAPEQARGSQSDGRTDVHGVGAILYFLLTGRPLYQGKPREIVRQLAAGTLHAQSPESIDPTIPKPLAAICRRCVNADPDRRYATMIDLATDLQRYLDGQVVAAMPVSPVHRIWMWCTRNPLAASALATIITLAFGVLMLGVLTLRAGRREFAIAQAEREAHTRAVQSIEQIRTSVLETGLMRQAEMRPLVDSLTQLLLNWYTASLSDATRSLDQRRVIVGNSLLLADTLRKRGSLQDASRFLTALTDASDQVASLSRANSTAGGDPTTVRHQILARDALVRSLLAGDEPDREDRAAALIDELVDFGKTARRKPDRVRALNAAAGLLYFLHGRPGCERGFPLAKESLAIAETLDVVDPDNQTLLAESLNRIGLIAYKNSPAVSPERELIETYYRRALRILDPLLQSPGDDPTRGPDPTLVSLSAGIRSNLGMYINNKYSAAVGHDQDAPLDPTSAQRLHREAIDNYAKAIDIVSRAVQDDPLNYELLSTKAKLSWNAADLMQFQIANPNVRYRQIAIESFSAIGELHSTGTSVNGALAIQRSRYAYQLVQLGDVGESWRQLQLAYVDDRRAENVPTPCGNLLPVLWTLARLSQTDPEILSAAGISHEDVMEFANDLIDRVEVQHVADELNRDALRAICFDERDGSSLTEPEVRRWLAEQPPDHFYLRFLRLVEEIGP